MTFTSLTTYADTRDIINARYLGRYDNTNNRNSFFSIRSDNDYPIVALAVYSSTSKIYFNGSGEDVVMGYPEFGANFHKVRKTDENGNILVDQWFYNVALAGTTSTSLMGSIVTVTMQTDCTVFVKQ